MVGKMIDIHCHILPGCDDGPMELADSLIMAKAAVSEGITHLFATPHHLNGNYENTKSEIMERVHRFNLSLMKAEIPLTIYSGQELRIHHELLKALNLDEILTLDNRGDYLLIELPSGEVPSFSLDIIYELGLRGITPILVHPERNRELMEDPSLLFELVQEGVLTQLTAASIIGHFGKRVKNFSEKIIEHNLAHFIASDAHNVGSRNFFLNEAYETITRKFGINRTFYFRENAELLKNGQHLFIPEPVLIRKKFLGIF
jgi:protein-tyrosine phosphatase